MKKHTNIKKWKLGDCFIKKINSSKYPEYNGKYFIIITADYYQYDYNKEDSIYPIIYLKLSNKEVKTIDDINEAEFVIIEEEHWSSRRLPINGSMTREEFIKSRDSVELFPDEYGFLKEYKLCIIPSRKNSEYLSDVEYLHIDFSALTKPSDEFFHWQRGLINFFQSDIFDSRYITDKFIRFYKMFNLRKWVFYQLPLEEMKAHKDNMQPIYEKYYYSFIKDYNMDEH